MTDNTQPEALRLAQELDEVPETGGDPDSIQECAPKAAPPAFWHVMSKEHGEAFLHTAEGAEHSRQKGHTVTALYTVPAPPPAEQQATKETLGGVNGWRDISTAPKDGSRFVAIGYNYGLYSECRHICVAQWFRGCWMEASDWNETSELKYLTHWMPLPSPPDDVAAPAEQQAQPAAIGAGGVNGPLMGQPQAMPDLTALTERGAKAWTAVDAQALREGRWYMVTHDGVATLCEDRRDAEKEAKDADMAWPHSGPHRAVQLVEASTAGFTAADMATASAQGFRDGVASLSANAGEPTCDMRTVVAVAVTMLYDTHPEDVCRVFDRNDLETIVSITEPLGHGRVEDIYRDAWDHVAAPPTAQAEGWMLVPVEPTAEMLRAGDQKTWVLPALECWRAMIAAAPTPPTSAEVVEHG